MMITVNAVSQMILKQFNLNLYISCQLSSKGYLQLIFKYVNFNNPSLDTGIILV